MDHVGDARRDPALDIALDLTDDKEHDYHYIHGEGRMRIAHLLIREPQRGKGHYHRGDSELDIDPIFAVLAAQIIDEPGVDGGHYVAYDLADIHHYEQLAVIHAERHAGELVADAEAY